MKDRMKQLKSKAGMTYVELLVAFTLLVFILMAFSPMLLKSYNWVYQAGERVSDTYEAKSEIEKELSIREDDELVNNGNGIAVSMREFGNNFAIQMRRIETSVNGLETIYGVGKAELRIISSEVVADNQSYYPIVVRLVNFEGTSVSIGTTFSSDKSKIIIDVKSMLKDDSGIKYSIKSENIDKNIIKIIIENADITYSPFEMTAYYYDEYGRKRTTTSHVFISEPDLMLAGKSTAEAQYLTSAGVITDDSGKDSMIIAARKMEDMEVPADTKINKVRWLSTYDGSDLGIRTGTYAMCGIQEDGNAFIRRLWNLDSEGGATYSKTYKPDGVVYVNNIAYYKYIWGSDYTQSVKHGWIKGKSTSSENVKQTESLTNTYNNLVAMNMENTFEAGTNYMMQLGEPYSSKYLIEYMKENAGGFTTGVIVKNRGKNNITRVDGGQQPNLQGGDGYSGINLSTNKKRSDGWISYVDYNITGLTQNISSSNANLNGKNSESTNGEGSDPTSKSSGSTSFSSAAPILFFAADGTTNAENIDRYFIPADNNWGSELKNLSYGGGWETGLIKKTWNEGSSFDLLGWTVYNPSYGFVSAGSAPIIWDNEAKVWDYYQHWKSSSSTTDKSNRYILQRYINGNPDNGQTAHWGGWEKKGTAHGEDCWICDVPAMFTAQITTNNNKYVINPTDTRDARQRTIMDLILDNIGLNEGDKVIIDPLVNAFVGDESYSNTADTHKFDERCSFIRLKSYSNFNGTFNKTGINDKVTVDKSLTYSKEKNNLGDVGFNDNTNSAEVELTDVFYIKDANESSENVVYTGITPASAIVYAPYINSASATTRKYDAITDSPKETVTKSDGYVIYLITSYGDDGFAVYTKENGGHDDFKNTTEYASAFWSGKRMLDTASFTLGYSSNYNLLFGNLEQTELEKFSNAPLDLATPLSDYDNKQTGYTKDFYNITTFTESEGYTFAVGYKVISYASPVGKSTGGTDKSSFDEAYYKSRYNLETIYYATCPADFFTSDNFGYVCDSTTRKYATYKSDMTTLVNTNSDNATENIAAFYFDTKDNKNGAFVRSYPSSGYAYTAYANTIVPAGKESDTSIECNAVANEGVIEYMNPGDTSFTQLKFTFASDTPYNYKFTDVSFVKTGGKIEKDSEGNVIVDEPDKLELILSASNGSVYHGTLDFTITTSTVQATDPVTGEPLYVEDRLGNKTPVYEQTAVINPGQVVQLSSITCSDLSQVRTVSTVKYEKDDGSTVTVLLAAGKPKATGTAIYASTDLGATWTKVDASSTTYDIYDIQASGEYVYAVGTTSNGNNGVVLYKKTAECSTNSAWTAVTQYSKTFKTVGLGADLVGSDKADLPPIYTCASKSA